MPFFGTVTERAFRAKIQSTDTYKLMQCCVVDFPPEKVLGDGPAFWIFGTICR